MSRLPDLATLHAEAEEEQLQDASAILDWLGEISVDEARTSVPTCFWNDVDALKFTDKCETSALFVILFNDGYSGGAQQCALKEVQKRYLAASQKAIQQRIEKAQEDHEPGPDPDSYGDRRRDDDDYWQAYANRAAGVAIAP